MSNPCDAIVVGLGAAGSTTAYHLAKRGRRVLELDMFGPGHDQGSSHGYHRLIRRSSVQVDGYVPLGERAFELWDEIAAESGRQLLWMTGEIRIVDTSHRPGFAAVAERMLRGGSWEILDEAALRGRFPSVRPLDGMIFTYEPTAGFLLAEGACSRTSTWPRATGPKSITTKRSPASRPMVTACASRQPRAPTPPRNWSSPPAPGHLAE